VVLSGGESKMARLKIVLLAGLLGAFALLSACWVSSIQPLYDQEHLVYDGALVGRWQPEPDDSILAIEGDVDHKTYTLQYVSSADNKKDVCKDNLASPPVDLELSGPFAGHLVQLGSVRFLDVFPDGFSGSNLGWIPSHTIFKVSVDPRKLSLTPPNASWLCDSTHPNGNVVGQCGSDPDGYTDFLFTATTPVLQEFLREHASDGEVYSPGSQDLVYERGSGGSR
jgi:hypothetical protein